jgi:hypothetical protein
MSEQTASPAWMPFSVREAKRTGSATGDDLSSGAAWQRMLDALARASEVVRSDRVPRNPVDTAAGFRHLLVLLELGIDEVLRGGGSNDPIIKPGNTDHAVKWGMDCPDCAYSGSPLRGGEVYRITGNRGTARYVGLQANAGMAATANLLLDDLELEPNGDFELTASVDEVPGNWLPMDPGASMLIIRQFFYDWDHEVPARLAIERISGGDGDAATTRPDETGPDAAMARQLDAIGAFVEANLDFFLAFARPEAPNGFLAGIDRSNMGAAAENRPVIGSWKLAPDEALVLEVTPPNGLYWGLSLGNVWWETIDYARRLTSINGHQAVLDDDGVLRVVVAHQDPGSANWLDTAGHSEGPMILRCVRTDDAPVPATRVVPFDRLGDELPAGTARVTPEQRTRTVAARARAVARRFPR